MVKAKNIRLSPSFNLSPTNVLLNEMFRGDVLSTLATVTSFLLTILYRAGYFSFNGSLPI